MPPVLQAALELPHAPLSCTGHNELGTLSLPSDVRLSLLNSGSFDNSAASQHDVLYYYCSALSVIRRSHMSYPTDELFWLLLGSIVFTDDVGPRFSDDVGIGTFDVVGHRVSDISPFPPPTVSAIRTSKISRCSCIKNLENVYDR
eukprot:Gb_15714 [translate_table: standard]